MSQPEHIGIILARVMDDIGAPTELCEMCGRRKAIGSINGVAVCNPCIRKANEAAKEYRRPAPTILRPQSDDARRPIPF